MIYTLHFRNFTNRKQSKTESLVVSVYGQNGDRPKRLKSKRRHQNKEIKTATNENGDKPKRRLAKRRQNYGKI